MSSYAKTAFECSSEIGKFSFPFPTLRFLATFYDSEMKVPLFLLRAVWKFSHFPQNFPNNLPRSLSFYFLPVILTNMIKQHRNMMDHFTGNQELNWFKTVFPAKAFVAGLLPLGESMGAIFFFREKIEKGDWERREEQSELFRPILKHMTLDLLRISSFASTTESESVPQRPDTYFIEFTP